ncbi:MAG TPA: prepilin-type N-terminal cleavage/methylation domain-containing protein [Pyrinomonadaceae bacterium]|nr:prepilin-type N-terminal cleavage/methylation domain-containing protein [Pyrinomonadaceae bacterium]
MSNDNSGMASHASDRSQAGFTLIEMVAAMLIMMIALLALAATIAFALAVSNKGRTVTNTKLLVVSILEQMETLRNTKQLTYAQISNAGHVDNTGATQSFEGFPNDFREISMNPGPDGIFGTTDDFVDAGPDATYGTNDDFVNPSLARPGYTRQILITPLSDNLKKIQVTIQSPSQSGGVDSIVGISYLNNDAHSNFLP